MNIRRVGVVVLKILACVALGSGVAAAIAYIVADDYVHEASGFGLYVGLLVGIVNALARARGQSIKQFLSRYKGDFHINTKQKLSYMVVGGIIGMVIGTWDKFGDIECTSLTVVDKDGWFIPLSSVASTFSALWVG